MRIENIYISRSAGHTLSRHCSREKVFQCKKRNKVVVNILGYLNADISSSRCENLKIARTR